MVQISHSLIIIAAAVVPALAAPVLEAREPLNLRPIRSKVGTIVGQVGDANLLSKPANLLQQQGNIMGPHSERRFGFGLGPAVESNLIPVQNHRLVARATGVTGVGPKRINFGLGPAIHKTLPQANIMGVGPKRIGGLGPAVANLIPVQNHRLVAREPRITKAQAKVFAKGAGKIAHHIAHGVEFGAAAGTLASTATSAVQQRELDDIEARGFFHSLKHDLGGAAHDILKADATGLTVASKGLKFVPGVGKGVATAAGVAAKGVNAVANNVNARDFSEEDDLMARGRFPKFHLPGSHMRNGGRAAAGFPGSAAFATQLPQVAQRDFDDFELEAREPHFGFGSLLHKAEGVAGKFIREDELEAREPKFRLGSIFHKAEGLAGKFIRETPEIDELD